MERNPLHKPNVYEKPSLLVSLPLALFPRESEPHSIDRVVFVCFVAHLPPRPVCVARRMSGGEVSASKPADPGMLLLSSSLALNLFVSFVTLPCVQFRTFQTSRLSSAAGSDPQAGSACCSWARASRRGRPTSSPSSTRTSSTRRSASTRSKYRWENMQEKHSVVAVSPFLAAAPACLVLPCVSLCLSACLWGLTLLVMREHLVSCGVCVRTAMFALLADSRALCCLSPKPSAFVFAFALVSVDPTGLRFAAAGGGRRRWARPVEPGAKRPRQRRQRLPRGRGRRRAWQPTTTATTGSAAAGRGARTE